MKNKSKQKIKKAKQNLLTDLLGTRIYIKSKTKHKEKNFTTNKNIKKSIHKTKLY